MQYVTWYVIKNVQSTTAIWVTTENNNQLTVNKLITRVQDISVQLQDSGRPSVNVAQLLCLLQPVNTAIWFAGKTQTSTFIILKMYNVHFIENSNSRFYDLVHMKIKLIWQGGSNPSGWYLCWFRGVWGTEVPVGSRGEAPVEVLGTDCRISTKFNKNVNISRN